jgi:predicted ATPase
MPLTAISIEGYRSVRRLYLPIGKLSVFVGANGVGKTNLYNALGLLHAAADGTIVHAIAAQGGMESALWAGARKKGDAAEIVLKAHFGDTSYGISDGLLQQYEIRVGLRMVTEAAFALQPLVKEERLTVRHGQRDVVMMERKRNVVMLRNADGARETHPNSVLSSRRHSPRSAIPHAIRNWRLSAVRCRTGACITISGPTRTRRSASPPTPS